MSSVTVGATAGRQRLIGIALVVCGVSLFPVLDTLVKLMAARIDLVMVIWGRYAFHLLAIPLFVPPSVLPTVSRTRRLGLQVLRSTTAIIATGFFFLGLTGLPLAEANAINFLTPFWVTILAVPILGETVGLRRWIACGLGFVGALIVIRPGMEGATWYTVFPLLASFFFGLYYIQTRQLAATEPVYTTLFYTALVGTVVTSVMAPFFWTWPSALEWCGMAAMGLIAAFSHWLMIKAYSHAPASVLAPFNYTILLSAVILGYLVFGSVPDIATIIGAGIIVGSGLYNAHREFRASRTASG